MMTRMLVIPALLLLSCAFVSAHSTEDCSSCSSIVTKLRLPSSRSNAELYIRLTELCTEAFGGSHSSNCTRQLGRHFKELVRSEMPPEVVCSHARLCNSVARDPCTDCDNFMNDAKDMYLSVLVQMVSEAWLESKCTKWPFKEECRAMVREIGDRQLLSDNVHKAIPRVFGYLRENFSPEATCVKIKMCSSGGIASIRPTSPADNSRITGSDHWAQSDRMSTLTGVTIGSEKTCMLCNWILQIVESKLDGNSDTITVGHALAETCPTFPERYREQCVNIVGEFGQRIAPLFSNFRKSSDVCEAIGLCIVSFPLPLENVMLLMPTESDETPCEQCKNFANFTLQMCNTAEGQSALIDLVSSFCSVTGSHGAGCRTLVEYVVPKMTHAVGHNTSATEVCTATGLCSAPTVLMLQEP